jgi:predicted ATPase
MLIQLRLAGFKSFVDESVELAPLTVLVGANAAGKSNLLDAVRFLQGIALDMTLNPDFARPLGFGPRSGRIHFIEKGLHPTRAHLLVEAMEAAATLRSVQVIATTHSPLVLNALSRDALRRAVLVARPPESEGTLLRRLGDLPDFEAVCERRGIDRLIASGMGGSWRGMLQVCPEIAQLASNIDPWLKARP